MEVNTKCPVLIPISYSFAQRVYHTLQGIDTDTAFNCEPVPDMPTSEVAGLLNSTIRRLKTEFFDIESGKVDYVALRNHPMYEAYKRATLCLQNIDLTQITHREDKLAFWINLYNALIVDAVIQYNIETSVNEIRGFFSKAAYVVGGYRFSADDIEHGILRANQGHPAIPGPQFSADDPRAEFAIDHIDYRIHCALVCASASCPPISIYEPVNIDDQLDLAMKNFVNGGEFDIDLEDQSVSMSQIFRWYAPDFGGTSLNQLGFGSFTDVFIKLAPHVINKDKREQFLADPSRFKVKFKDYDWTLNIG